MAMHSSHGARAVLHATCRGAAWDGVAFLCLVLGPWPYSSRQAVTRRTKDEALHRREDCSSRIAYCSVKLMVTVNSTSMGTPLSSVGS